MNRLRFRMLAAVIGRRTVAPHLYGLEEFGVNIHATRQLQCVRQ